jgi:STIMATE family
MNEFYWFLQKVKRRQEKPQRCWTIFALDTSKQVCSNIMLHFFNTSVAIYFVSSASEHKDECSGYFLSVMLDTTIGVLLVFLILKGSECFFQLVGLKVEFFFHF